LPVGWGECALEEVVHDVTYGYTAKSNSSVGDARMLRITDIQNNKVDWSSVPYCQISTADIQKYTLQKFDLVFARTGATVGKSFLIKEDVEQAVFASYLIRVRPSLTEMARYLSYFFGSDSYWNQVVDFSAGIGQPNVNGSKLKQLQIPLAPLPEQKRIADKLDSVLARVDVCRDRLDRLPSLLKRFRQSILAAATSGRLTEDWRKANLAANWKTVRLEEVAKGFSYGSAAKSSKSGSVPVLRMGNIQNGCLDWTDLVFTSDPDEIEKYRLVDGDVLFNRTNSPELVGKTAVFKGTREAIYAGYLIRVRGTPKLLPDYLNYCLGSPAGRDYCWQVKSDGVSQSNINAKKLAAFELELPTPREQTEIVRRVELLFAFADRLEARLASARRQVGQLTPALLAKAFRGELVPQDPADEPATELLKRLAAQREAAPKAKRTRAKS
jgi:type I restriction enzyme S subunit